MWTNRRRSRRRTLGANWSTNLWHNYHDVMIWRSLRHFNRKLLFSKTEKLRHADQGEESIEIDVSAVAPNRQRTLFDFKNHLIHNSLICISRQFEYFCAFYGQLSKSTKNTQVNEQKISCIWIKIDWCEIRIIVDQ